MPTPPVPEAEAERRLDAIRRHHGNVRSAAAELGMSRSTLASFAHYAGWRRDLKPPIPAPGAKIEFEPIPTELEGNELVDNIIARNSRAQEVAFARNLRQVKIKETKPFGILIFGDPHIDDRHCDLREVRKCLEYTHLDGVYGTCVGDFTNAWGGKLVSLYQNETVTKDEAVGLIKWFIQSGNWIALGVSGNHEKMASHDPVKILAEEYGLVYHDWKLRMEFKFPKWKGAHPIRFNMAHNYPGSSPHVTAFAGMKQARFQERDDLYVCGHLHKYGIVREVIDGKLITSVRVSGFKRHDDYAIRYGYTGDDIGAVLAVICPDRGPAGRVTVYEDLEMGLRVLESLRG